MPRSREVLESDPKTVVVAPRLSFSGLVSHGDATMSFIGEGVVPEREPAIHTRSAASRRSTSSTAKISQRATNPTGSSSAKGSPRTSV